MNSTQQHTLFFSLLLLACTCCTTWAQLGDPIRVNTAQVSAVRFSHDGRYFLTMQSDTLRFWETSTGKQVGLVMGMGGRNGMQPFFRVTPRC